MHIGLAVSCNDECDHILSYFVILVHSQHSLKKYMAASSYNSLPFSEHFHCALQETSLALINDRRIVITQYNLLTLAKLRYVIHASCNHHEIRNKNLVV